MTTTSYPKADGNYTSAQWRGVFDGAVGIIDADGSAASCGDLVRTNASDVATIAAGFRMKYRGFVVEVTADQGFTLAPATTSPLTYSIGCQYNPATEGTNPLSLVASLKTAIDTSSGKTYHPIYEVTRQTSQTLDLAGVKDFRQYTADPIMVPALTVADLPTDAPLGTLAYVGSEQYLRVRSVLSAAWSNLTNPTYAAVTLASGAISAFGEPLASRVRLGQVELKGGVQKTTPFFGTATVVGTLPVGQRPARTWRFAVACSYNEAGTTARVEVGADGSISVLAPTSGTVDHSWVQFDGISFPVGG